MSEYQKLVMLARYAPTTVGNMVMGKNGEYCSSEAFEDTTRGISPRIVY